MATKALNYKTAEINQRLGLAGTAVQPNALNDYYTKSEIGGKVVVDLSVRYSTSYADFSAALTALNSDATATSIKKGGVSIKFINSSTNKYEQWNLKASSWSTTTSDWALDADGSITNGKLKLPFELEKPSSNEFVTQASQIGCNGGSNVQVELYTLDEKNEELSVIVNGGTSESVIEVEKVEGETIFVDKYVNTSLEYASNPSSAEGFATMLIPCQKGDTFLINAPATSASAAVKLYVVIDDTRLILSSSGTLTPSSRETPIEVTINDDSAAFLIVNFNMTYNAESDKVSKRVTIEHEGLVSNISELETSINLVQQELGTLDEKVNYAIEGGETEIIIPTSELNLQFGHYYNTNSVYLNSPGELERCTCTKITCSEGDKIKLYGKSQQSIVVLYYAFWDASNARIARADAQVYNTRTNGLLLTAPANAKYLTVNFDYYNAETDKITKIEYKEGLDEQVEKNTTDIEELSERLEPLEAVGSKSISKSISPSMREATIVSLIYDDEFSQDLIDMCDERGIKVTFALIGNVSKENSYWKTSAKAMQIAMKNGHGCCAHGVVRGFIPSAGAGAGLDTLNDADAIKTIEYENKSFDDYNLPHNGLVAFNTYTETAHCTKLVRNYYKYLMQFKTATNVPQSTDLYGLGRISTDTQSQINNVKAYIDIAVKNRTPIFIGGHFGKTGGEGRRTGAGGSYSTMASFIDVLDYIKDLMDKGMLISLNLDDAVECIWNTYRQKNGIAKVDYNLNNPSLYATKYDNGIKVCTDQGAFYIVSCTISGTPTNGSFTLVLGANGHEASTENAQNVTIITKSTDTIEGIVNTIVSKVFTAYTVTKKSASEIVMYRDIIGTSFTPNVKDNTSGLIFTFAVMQYGREAVWQ